MKRMQKVAWEVIHLLYNDEFVAQLLIIDIFNFNRHKFS